MNDDNNNSKKDLPPDMPQPAPIQMVTETFSQVVIENNKKDRNGNN